MQSSAESIRKHFLKLHGEAAFESVAKLFAEVSGDSTRIDLSSVSAWREFAGSFAGIPLSSVLSKAFLWCNRHGMRLEDIRRPTIPKALNEIDDPDVIRVLFEHCPFFLASSKSGFRCPVCFDKAVELTEMYVSGDRKISSFQIAAQSLSPRPHSIREPQVSE